MLTLISLTNLLPMNEFPKSSREATCIQDTVDKFHLVFECLLHRHLVIAILLGSVDKTNVSKFEENFFVHKNLLNTGAFIHSVNFSVERC